MTLTIEYNWEAVGYRVIPEWSGYVLGSDKDDVWSLSRQVACKGGGTRLTVTKQIKVSEGRVSLSQDGRSGRFHVRNDLYPLVYPDLIRPRAQVMCCHGHPLHPPITNLLIGRRLGEPKLAVWGSGNRICLRCWELAGTFATHTYSRPYGVAGLPDYYSAIAEPKLRTIDFAELDWDENGYLVRDRP